MNIHPAGLSCRLKGVPLAYDNIRILGHYGDIVDDSGYIHMDVMADFIVFQPEKGQKLLVRVVVLSLLLVLFVRTAGSITAFSRKCRNLCAKYPRAEHSCLEG